MLITSSVPQTSIYAMPPGLSPAPRSAGEHRCGFSAKSILGMMTVVEVSL
ncbi:MAG: hypothetical protein WAN75_29760 [Xanthobacteraceae bacterium]